MAAEKILFITDDLEYKWFEFNKLVTNFWFIKEFLQSGFEVYVAIKKYLFIRNSKAASICNRAYLLNNGEISYEKSFETKEIEWFDTVFFRPDPPVDIDYINACSVFEFVDQSKVNLINNPISIRNFNEKMHVNLFPQFVPDNIVTSSKDMIIDFVKKHEKAIIKPMNRCFGSGVFILEKGDMNISSIIAAATENGKTSVMVQEYLKGAINGDKRVLIAGEKVFDECVRKLPAPNDFKFAQHSDKYFEKAPLTEEERVAAEAAAKKLNAMGMPLVGLDMIDGKIIEINVTSPCYFINEINNLYNINFEKKLMPEIYKISGLYSYAAISL